MKKLLIFHPALAPYRVDQFNALSKLFDFEVVFIFDNVWNHKFDQSKLLSQLKFKVSYLLSGIRFKGRVLRFGMLKHIKKTNPDIILGYEYSFTTQYLILLKQLGLISQKIGSTIDDSIDICEHVQSKTRYFARKQTVNRLDFLIVLSDEVSSYYQNTFGLKKKQIIVSPILQNPDRLRMNSGALEQIARRYADKYQLQGKKILLFVGRFIPEKGLVNFLNIVTDVLKNQDKFLLVFVGDGEERKSIERLVEVKGLNNAVSLPGRFEGDELYAWYLSATGFVLPSIYEPFGAVVNEALIFGLKVLCSVHAGSAVLIGENGTLFNPNDEQDTLSKLVGFIDSMEFLENTQLADRPSLMQNNEDDFKKEWEIMIYD